MRREEQEIKCLKEHHHTLPIFFLLFWQSSQNIRQAFISFSGSLKRGWGTLNYFYLWFGLDMIDSDRYLLINYKSIYFYVIIVAFSPQSNKKNSYNKIWYVLISKAKLKNLEENIEAVVTPPQRGFLWRSVSRFEFQPEHLRNFFIRDYSCTLAHYWSNYYYSHSAPHPNMQRQTIYKLSCLFYNKSFI
jgi:hypothetical protein